MFAKDQQITPMHPAARTFYSLVAQGHPPQTAALLAAQQHGLIGSAGPTPIPTSTLPQPGAAPTAELGGSANPSFARSGGFSLSSLYPFMNLRAPPGGYTNVTGITSTNTVLFKFTAPPGRRLRNLRVQFQINLTGTALTAAFLSALIDKIQIYNEQGVKVGYYEGKALSPFIVGNSGLHKNRPSGGHAMFTDPSVTALSTTFIGFWEIWGGWDGSSFRVQIDTTVASQAFTITGTPGGTIGIAVIPEFFANDGSPTYHSFCKYYGSVPSVQANQCFAYFLGIDNTELSTVTSSWQYGPATYAGQLIKFLEELTWRLNNDLSTGSTTVAGLAEKAPNNPVSANYLGNMIDAGEAVGDLKVTFTANQNVYLGGYGVLPVDSLYGTAGA